MLRKFTVALAIISSLSFISAAAKTAENTQVIRLERFRKALWKVHVTVK